MSDWSDIGARLRQERESRGWSLRDVAHRTRIPAHTIDELERNDYRAFPSSAYAKSFLAQYSELLEIDAEDWLEKLETQDSLANLKSYEYLKEHHERLGDEPAPLKAVRPRAKPAPVAEPAAASQSSALQPLVVFVLTAGLLTLGAFGYLRISEKIGADDPGPDPLTQPDPGFVEAPSIVHSRPAPTRTITAEPIPAETTVAAADAREKRGQPAVGVATPLHEDGTPMIDFDAPPPRAVIVEE